MSLKHNINLSKYFRNFAITICILPVTFYLSAEQLNVQNIWLTKNKSDTTQLSLSKHTDVFIGGKEGYPIYRIPSVISTLDETLLAFCEGRSALSDHAQNDIVMKRSFNGGKTWEPLQIIAEDGKNCLSNPTVVQVRESGRILLMYQKYPYGFHEREVVPGYKGDRICRSFLIYSDDDGSTWTIPREITRQVKRKKTATSIACGPGIGIQIKNGKYKKRIIIPFNQGPYGDWQVYTVYSDDGGDKWKMGKIAPRDLEGMGNEVQVVELNNGHLMLNSRSANGNKQRKFAFSNDGGETWSSLSDDEELIEPQCQASILRFSFPGKDKKSRILFTNPASTSERTHGTIRISYDEGKTWPVNKLIYKGSFAYSCLTKIDNKTIGLLYEADNYSKIRFANKT